MDIDNENGMQMYVINYFFIAKFFIKFIIFINKL